MEKYQDVPVDRCGIDDDDLWNPIKALHTWSTFFFFVFTKITHYWVYPSGRNIIIVSISDNTTL